MIKKNDFKLKKLELQNEFYKLALSQFDFIKSVLKKYDGKKITKRIESELNKNIAGINYNLEKKIEWWQLSIFCNNRSFQENGNTIYIDNSAFFIINYHREDILNYKKIETEMNKTFEYYQTKFEKQKEVLLKLDKLIENQNKFFYEINKNTSELQNLSECFVGYEGYLNYKIK
jgi:hypothetical protein